MYSICKKSTKPAAIIEQAKKLKNTNQPYLSSGFIRNLEPNLQISRENSRQSNSALIIDNSQEPVHIYDQASDILDNSQEPIHISDQTSDILDQNILSQFDDLPQTILNRKYVTLIGSPGAGKTTIVYYITFMLSFQTPKTSTFSGYTATICDDIYTPLLHSTDMNGGMDFISDSFVHIRQWLLEGNQTIFLGEGEKYSDPAILTLLATKKVCIEVIDIDCSMELLQQRLQNRDYTPPPFITTRAMHRYQQVKSLQHNNIQHHSFNSSGCTALQLSLEILTVLAISPNLPVSTNYDSHDIGELCYITTKFPQGNALTHLLSTLHNGSFYMQEYGTLDGKKKVPKKRFTFCIGDTKDCGVAYKGTVIIPSSPHPTLQFFKDWINLEYNKKYNNVQVFLVPPQGTTEKKSDGTIHQVGVNYHADDHPCLQVTTKENICVTGLSLPSAVDNQWCLSVRLNDNREQIYSIPLPPQTLYFHPEKAQTLAQHASMGPELTNPRLSLIFRQVVPGKFYTEGEQTLNEINITEGNPLMTLQNIMAGKQKALTKPLPPKKKQKTSSTGVHSVPDWVATINSTTGHCWTCTQSCGGKCGTTYIGAPNVAVGSIFKSQQQLDTANIFKNNFGAIQGSQPIGAQALKVTTTNNYHNIITRDETGTITQIQITGKGGRQKTQIMTEDNKPKIIFDFTHNQPLSKNYAIITSAEYKTPIRVILQEAEYKFIYEGLWLCSTYTYGPTNFSQGHSVYVFTLIPYNK
eukprot:Phypoly_transcript_03391.p1 GENE.Phypoly_transcript_03391~~Phypoly_transcript_03391.p1  ORF type:complete len:750 (+),score=55.44 Phypoly_transcript_03391:213-2462(+)